jgi:hypothetical protein
VDDIEFKIASAGNQAIDQADALRSLVNQVSERSSAMGENLDRLITALEDVGNELRLAAGEWHGSWE